MVFSTSQKAMVHGYGSTSKGIMVQITMWISNPDLGEHLFAYELYELPCSSGRVGVRHGDSQDEATGADNARRDLRIAQVISADLGDMDLPTFQQ
jgi:hypothetical protein